MTGLIYDKYGIQVERYWDRHLGVCYHLRGDTNITQQAMNNLLFELTRLTSNSNREVQVGETVQVEEETRMITHWRARNLDDEIPQWTWEAEE